MRAVRSRDKPKTTYEGYIASVRAYLTESPTESHSAPVYTDWARAANKAGARPRHVLANPMQAQLGLGWKTIPSVACGEVTLDEARQARADARAALDDDALMSRADAASTRHG